MSIETLQRTGKPSLAYYRTDAARAGAALPTVLFCGGFRSDMEGTKATFLEDVCKTRGQGYVRFDYSGHGQSEGAFVVCTIGDWKADTLDVLDELTSGDVIIIGSSMGGWIALLAALARPDRIKGIIGIAAAPDFTREIRDEKLNDAQRELLNAQGYFEEPNEYSDEPYVFTKKLFDDGDAHCLLDQELDINVPVRLLQGMQDNAVPWQKAHRIKNCMKDSELADVFLIESGDHSLSRPEDLSLLKEQLILLSDT